MESLNISINFLISSFYRFIDILKSFLYLYQMQFVARQLESNLIFANRAYFSNSMVLNPFTNPIKDRVMSTPTWPVPYYQRIAKAYPVRCTRICIQKKKSIHLDLKEFAADDSNWVSAKRTLNNSLKGRQIVEYTENHIKTNTYLIKKNDCVTMAKAYVHDVGQFLNAANRENVRILGGKTLI